MALYIRIVRSPVVRSTATKLLIPIELFIASLSVYTLSGEAKEEAKPI